MFSISAHLPSIFSCRLSPSLYLPYYIVSR